MHSRFSVTTDALDARVTILLSCYLRMYSLLRRCFLLPTPHSLQKQHNVLAIMAHVMLQFIFACAMLVKLNDGTSLEGREQQLGSLAAIAIAVRSKQASK